MPDKEKKEGVTAREAIDKSKEDGVEELIRKSLDVNPRLAESLRLLGDAIKSSAQAVGQVLADPEADKRAAEIYQGLHELRAGVEEITGESFKHDLQVLEYLQEETPTDLYKMTMGELLNTAMINEILEKLAEAVEVKHELKKGPDGDITKHTALTLKIFNLLTNPAIATEEGINANVWETGKERTLTPFKLEEIMEDENITLHGELTHEERRVLSEVISFYNQGQRVFTLNQICRVFRNKPQNDRKYNPDEKTKETVAKAIKRIKRTFVDIDYTAHYERYTRRNKKDGSKITVTRWKDEPLANIKIIETVTETENGEKITEDHYLIAERPVLLTYALDVDQIRTIPREAFEIPGRMSEQRIRLARELALDIEHIKDGWGKKQRNDHINLENLLDRCGVDGSNRYKRTRIVKSIDEILEHNKNIDNIKGHEWITKGRGGKYKSIKILL